MSRTIATADLQAKYRVANVSCEVTSYLSGYQWVKHYLANNARDYDCGLHLHHIFGRGADCECWHNWIMVSPTAHTFIHDTEPNLGMLCCLYAKYRKQQRFKMENVAFAIPLPPFPEWKPDDSLILDIPEWIDRHYDDWPEANQKMADELRKTIEHG